ncbi:phage tail tape measure protein [Terrihabitans rhizophilus]|uniref:Phage tail tape measure protein n=1 Tax=Terrihabitans rhizophilus TaxID=3092662 RepID=A0ABU4RN77_9HYPH|nr:phage tail tape measure protein [Terrihabitans sp. PJ23]MDX6806301.1 phage tail tape measure protein [Terrihabitans sp. PJ23]
MARLSSELVLSLTDKVSGPARGVGRAIDDLERKQRGAMGLMRRQAKLTAQSAAGMAKANAMMLATTASYLAPVAGAMGGQSVITQAANFESALTGIQKKAGTTADETARLGEEIKALATSGDLAVPIQEIIGAYERGAAAGIPIDDLKQFAALSVKASDAFEMPAEEVGNFAAKLKTSLGLSDEAIRRTFDLTNSLADAGISDEKNIVDFVDRAGASLKTLGLSMENTLAAGATLLNIGMSSDVASTAMEAMSTKMLTVGTLTGKARKTFERFMGPVGKFSKAVGKDANGALLTLLDRVQELDSEDRMDFLKNFVGMEHASKILRLSDAVGELRRNQALAANETAWFGSLDKAYALKLDDFWSQWQLMKNQISELAIDLGTMGMPAFKAGLQGAVDLVKQVQDGMHSMEAKIDWAEVQKAKDAVLELNEGMSKFLGMDTSQSTASSFFERLARTVSTLAADLNSIIRVTRELGEFARDPAGFLANPDVEKKAEFERRMNEARDKGSGNGVKDTWDWFWKRREQVALEKAPRQIERMVPAPVPLEPIVTKPAEKSAAATMPLPAPRPNVLAPIAAEGEAAALKAQEIGSRIEQAFSVSARPNIDASSIRAARGEVEALASALQRIPGLAAEASQSAARAWIDADGLHADTTYPGY